MSYNQNVIELSGKATLIGSFPLKSHEEAVELILEYIPKIPCWPQLPTYPREGMLVQFSSGLPGFDPERLIIDPGVPDFETERLSFYEEYLAVTESGEDLENTRFKLTPAEAPGLFVLIEKASEKAPLPAVKGQITGPFTLAVGLKTPDGKAVFYDLELRDLVVKLVALKARWQVRKLKELSPSVIIFFDEPALSGFGSSAFVGVSREEVLAVLSEVIAEVHKEGGLAGVHVCGNTDWSLLTDSPTDIINFDAYGFYEKFITYDKELKSFLEKGGLVAWGLVPTLKSEDLEKETPDSLAERFRDLLKELSLRTGLSEEYLLSHSLLTPSCGMGTLSQELTLKSLKDLKILTEII